MRLFIAINFSEEVKDNLISTIDELKKYSLSGNYTAQENLHLTLAFLGEVHEKRIKKIRNAFGKINNKPFPITVSDFGSFMIRGEKLYWRGIEENKELEGLQQQLVSELKNEGFNLDEKLFKPHITLGRRCKMRKEFSQEAFSNNLTPVSMVVSRISLMESERIKGKLIYTEKLFREFE